MIQTHKMLLVYSPKKKCNNCKQQCIRIHVLHSLQKVLANSVDLDNKYYKWHIGIIKKACILGDGYYLISRIKIQVSQTFFFLFYYYYYYYYYYSILQNSHIQN